MKAVNATEAAAASVAQAESKETTQEAVSKKEAVRKEAEEWHGSSTGENAAAREEEEEEKEEKQGKEAAEEAARARKAAKACAALHVSVADSTGCDVEGSTQRSVAEAEVGLAGDGRVSGSLDDVVLMAHFERFADAADGQGKRSLSPSALEAALRALQIFGNGSEEVEQVRERVDINRDGLVNFDEFRCIFRRSIGRRPPPALTVDSEEKAAAAVREKGEKQGKEVAEEAARKAADHGKPKSKGSESEGASTLVATGVVEAQEVEAEKCEVEVDMDKRAEAETARKRGLLWSDKAGVCLAVRALMLSS